ncbi:MAG: DNA-binding protein WhiA [Sporichthyaceae bacterium]
MTTIQLAPPPAPALHRELAQQPIGARCCLATELTVALRLAGTFHLDHGSLRLHVALDHPVAIRRLAASIRAFSGYEPTVQPAPAPGRPNRHVLRLDTGAAPLASKLGLCDRAGRPVPGLPAHTTSVAACCRGAAWRAAYLASGSLSAQPTLRIGCPDRATAAALAALANRSAPRARVAGGVGSARVLVEVPGEVARLLAEMGAETAVCPAQRAAL